MESNNSQGEGGRVEGGSWDGNINNILEKSALGRVRQYAITTTYGGSDGVRRQKSDDLVGSEASIGEPRNDGVDGVCNIFVSEGRTWNVKNIGSYRWALVP